ncbi:hypothetical protein JNW89_13335, partial [Micromonospora sp. 4G55]|nr:hypothetical protein [Micromonospora sp. 4G55]
PPPARVRWRCYERQGWLLSGGTSVIARSRRGRRERKSAGDWVDYVDPQDSGRKVRILAEKWSGTPARWAEVAENGLRTRSKSCVKPYEQLAMTEPELAGQPAAELEYTCGDGETKRHGVWRGVVHDGKVYSFYLSATDAKFAESKPIFDEMVKSFQLTAAG